MCEPVCCTLEQEVHSLFVPTSCCVIFFFPSNFSTSNAPLRAACRVGVTAEGCPAPGRPTVVIGDKVTLRVSQSVMKANRGTLGGGRFEPVLQTAMIAPPVKVDGAVFLSQWPNVYYIYLYFYLYILPLEGAAEPLCANDPPSTARTSQRGICHEVMNRITRHICRAARCLFSLILAPRVCEMCENYTSQSLPAVNKS